MTLLSMIEKQLGESSDSYTHVIYDADLEEVWHGNVQLPKEEWKLKIIAKEENVDFYVASSLVPKEQLTIDSTVLRFTHKKSKEDRTKASDVLINETKDIKQVKGTLCKLLTKIYGYDALGFLSYKAGIMPNLDPFGGEPVFSSSIYGNRAIRYYDLDTIATHPMTRVEKKVVTIMEDLNDNYTWSFKQIGEWLRSMGK